MQGHRKGTFHLVSLNPLTPKISLVIFLTVCHTIIVIFVENLVLDHFIIPYLIFSPIPSLVYLILYSLSHKSTIPKNNDQPLDFYQHMFYEGLFQRLYHFSFPNIQSKLEKKTERNELNSMSVSTLNMYKLYIVLR